MKNLLRYDIEYIVHCEEDGTVIGPISKLHAHLPGVRETLAHYCSWSMVYNYRLHKYGLQYKKAKVYEGAMRDMGVAGHNCYVHEDNTRRILGFAENLQKEAQEEVGLSLIMYDDIDSFLDAFKVLKSGGAGTIAHIFKEDLVKNEINNERIGMGLILTNEEHMTFVDGEVIDFAWYSPEELVIKLPIMQRSRSIDWAFASAEAFRKKHNIY